MGETCNGGSNYPMVAQNTIWWLKIPYGVTFFVVVVDVDVE